MWESCAKAATRRRRNRSSPSPIACRVTSTAEAVRLFLLFVIPAKAGIPLLFLDRGRDCHCCRERQRDPGLRRDDENELKSAPRQLFGAAIASMLPPGTL